MAKSSQGRATPQDVRGTVPEHRAIALLSAVLAPGRAHEFLDPVVQQRIPTRIENEAAALLQKIEPRFRAGGYVDLDAVAAVMEAATSCVTVSEILATSPIDWNWLKRALGAELIVGSELRMLARVIDRRNQGAESAFLNRLGTPRREIVEALLSDPNQRTSELWKQLGEWRTEQVDAEHCLRNVKTGKRIKTKNLRMGDNRAKARNIHDLRRLHSPPRELLGAKV